MKTNCPTLEEVKKLAGIKDKSLDKREGIDKRLMKIKLDREKFVSKNAMVKKTKKMKKKSLSYSISYRPVLPKDIYYTEEYKYFFSYIIFDNDEVYPHTEFFSTYEDALNQVVHVQNLQLGE